MHVCIQIYINTHSQLQARFSKYELVCVCVRACICIRKYLCMHASLHVIMCICDLCVSLCASLHKVAICVFPSMSSCFVEAVWEFYRDILESLCASVFSCPIMRQPPLGNRSNRCRVRLVRQSYVFALYKCRRRVHLWFFPLFSPPLFSIS